MFIHTLFMISWSVDKANFSSPQETELPRPQGRSTQPIHNFFFPVETAHPIQPLTVLYTFYWQMVPH